jgi:hypothetical protein
MADPIFVTSYAGSKVTVYQDRLVWQMLFKKQTIPISQIASMDTNIPLYAGVSIETTGGKRFKIPVQPFAKQKLQDAIDNARCGGSSTQGATNNIDDLGKLSDLKEKGVITQEEFDAKKKQILGI